MTTFHRILGMLVLTLLAALVVVGFVLRVLRRTETPTFVWALQHWTENLLGVQVVTGLILLLLGRRMTGAPLIWLHYLYGSIFPLVALVAGRLAGLRRERYEFVGLAWGAFFAFALVLRAAQLGCGAAFSDLARCVVP